MFTGSKESLGIIKKVGEFRNKDAISLKRQPSDLCQMFSTTFNADYKNKDSMNVVERRAGTVASPCH